MSIPCTRSAVSGIGTSFDDAAAALLASDLLAPLALLLCAADIAPVVFSFTHIGGAQKKMHRSHNVPKNAQISR
jgi:hypothetical protein